jgi:hypothetical protein
MALAENAKLSNCHVIKDNVEKLSMSGITNGVTSRNNDSRISASEDSCISDVIICQNRIHKRADS